MLSQTLLPLLAVSVASFALAWPSQAKAGEPTRLSGPYTHENLSIYLVHGKSADGPVPLTLEEAMEKGKVKVHETGSVGQLEIENTGKEEVLVHAGDIVKGGQQDRVLTTTMILKSKSGRVPLHAFCVESGRWAARGKEDVKVFASSKEMMPSRAAKLAMKAMPAAPMAGEEVNADASLRELNEPNKINQRADLPNQAIQRGPGRGNSAVNPQGEVWKNVANIQAALSSNLGAKVASGVSESSLQLALENEKLLEAQKRYIEALGPAGEKDADVIGYVFAINGEINSADIYASNALFRKLWPRLLKASATEALGAGKAETKAEAPTAAAIEGFLADADKGKVSEREPVKGMKLKMREAEKTLDFETMSAAGVLVHRNVLSRH